MDYARATSGFVNEKGALDAAFVKDQDYKTSPERYGRMIGDLGEKWGREVRDEAVRAQFLRDVDTHAVRGVLAVQRHAFTLEREEERARLFADLERHRENAHNAKDGERGGVIAAGHMLIGAAVDKGHLTPGEAQALRTKWTHDYAETWTRGQLLDQQISLLESALDGNETGKPVDFLPKTKAADMHRRTVTELVREQRRVESEAALKARRLANQLNDEVYSIAATGQGVEEIDLPFIESALGADHVRTWRKARAIAHASYLQVQDLSTLPKSQIAARFEALRPVSEAEDFAEQQAIYAEVAKRASLIGRLRREDPARGVNDDPSVRAAADAFDPEHPGVPGGCGSASRRAGARRYPGTPTLADRSRGGAEPHRAARAGSAGAGTRGRRRNGPAVLHAVRPVCRRRVRACAAHPAGRAAGAEPRRAARPSQQLRRTGSSAWRAPKRPGRRAPGGNDAEEWQATAGTRRHRGTVA